MSLGYALALHHSIPWLIDMCKTHAHAARVCAFTFEVSLEELFRKEGKVSSHYLIMVLRRLGMNPSESEASRVLREP